jgi:hypothetical protein
MEMREAERDPHDGKRRVEAMWPIHKIHYQKNRWVGYALDSVCASTHVGVSVSVCVCVCVCVSDSQSLSCCHLELLCTWRA